MTDPAHPEHAERREWVGGPFDPAAFDLDVVNGELAEVAWPSLPVSAGRKAAAASAGPSTT